MKKSIFLSSVFLSLLLISCGHKHDAEKLISNFLDNNLVDNDIREKTFSDIDSTFYINDSIVNAMRANARTNRLVRKEAQYGTEKISGKLLFMSVKYRKNDGTIQKFTFYMDPELEEIVAFKQDAI